MVEYVTLTKQDLEVLIEISQQIVNYKSRRLSSSSWRQFESIYLPSLVEQLGDNRFKVVKAYNNTFRWLINQIQWSKQLEPGVRDRDQIHLAETVLGQRAIEICAAASAGQIHYDLKRKNLPNQDLFQIDIN